MKNILRLLTGGFTAAFFAIAAQAADLAPGAYSAGSVKGDVTYKLAGASEYSPLAAGVALPQGATIKTGANSSVLVVFGSGSTALIDQSSEIEITKFEQEVFSGPVPVGSEPSVSNTEIKVINGDITSKVSKLKKGSSFVIDTPVGAAGVRGTTFKVSYKVGSKTFSIKVTEGGVVFKNKTDGGGTETLVEAGKSLDVTFVTDNSGKVVGASLDLGDLSDAEKAEILKAVGAAAGASGGSLQTTVVGNVITIIDTTLLVSPN